MHKVGVITIWISLVVCVSGLIFGSIDMIKYGEFNIWMALVPAGFAGLLVGVTATLFSKK